MGRGVPTGERSQEKELGSVVHSMMYLKNTESLFLQPVQVLIGP